MLDVEEHFKATDCTIVVGIYLTTRTEFQAEMAEMSVRAVQKIIPSRIKLSNAYY